MKYYKIITNGVVVQTGFTSNELHPSMTEITEQEYNQLNEV